MLILTRQAIAAIENSMNTNGKSGSGVRINAEPGGCSGPKYSMRFPDEPDEQDVIIEIRDIRVFVDEASMSILSGATVDYSNAPDNFGFNFTLATPAEPCSPPQTASGCSCAKT
jgi:iron-sulfur cluster assembly protein